MKREEKILKNECYKLTNKFRTRLLLLADEDMKKTGKRNSPVKINSKNFSECAEQYEAIVVNLVEQTYLSSTNLNKGIKKMSCFQDEPHSVFMRPEVFTNGEILIRKSSVLKKKIRKSTKNLINLNSEDKLFNYKIKIKNDVKSHIYGKKTKSIFFDKTVSPQSKIKKKIVEGWDYLENLTKKLKLPAKKIQEKFRNNKNQPRASLQIDVLKELMMKLRENFCSPFELYKDNNKLNNEFKIEVKKCERKTESSRSTKDVVSLKKLRTICDDDISNKKNFLYLQNHSFSSKSSDESFMSENSSTKTQLKNVPKNKDEKQKENIGMRMSFEKDKKDFIINMKKCEPYSHNSSDRELEVGCMCCSRHSTHSPINTSGYSSCRKRKVSEITPLSTLE
jgi:hypothetical protein